jgi:predicted DsbA family dithiol-disulfide isomerase
MPPVKLTCYLEVLSSWCYYAEPVWAELQERYAGRVEFVWQIALMNPADFPVSRAQCDWFYRRSGTITRQPRMLNSGWFDPALKGDYRAANYVAEAGRDLGIHDDSLRLALSTAALEHGQKIGDLKVAVAVAARQLKLDARELKSAAQSKKVQKRVAASTAEFHAHQVNQRPTFIATDSIGDKAVFSGLVKIEPIAAALDAMLADCAGYQTFTAHHGQIPNQ